MFSSIRTSKPVRYLPLIINQRSKVRILPDKRTPYEIEMGNKKKTVDTFVMNILSVLQRKNLTWAHFKHWRKWKLVDMRQNDQKYVPERHKILGPDLATTHFLTGRGGKVKFTGNDKWITVKDIETNEVPSSYAPDFYIEEIDASGTELCYEGFDNFCNLYKLKKLHLINCSYIDDWCLSRFHLFEGSLEYLDISGCHLVTERGICALHKLKKLKTLIINDTPNIQNKELVALLLQDVIPECNIIGVSYDDPILLQRIENFMC